MLTIDRLVLRLPSEFARRGDGIGRAIGAALTELRPGQAADQARLAVRLGSISPATSDRAIAETVARSVATELGAANSSSTKKLP